MGYLHGSMLLLSHLSPCVASSNLWMSLNVLLCLEVVVWSCIGTPLGGAIFRVAYYNCNITWGLARRVLFYIV
jgi:hypothetical protein